MSKILNPTGSASHWTLNSVASAMASSPGFHKLAFWSKGAMVNSTYLASVATTATNNSAGHIYLVSAGSLVAFRTRANGTDNQSTVSYPGTGWSLYCMTFKTTTGAGGYSGEQHSINSGALSGFGVNAGTAAAVDNLTLGAAHFNGSAFGQCQNRNFAYLGVWTGSWTNDLVDELYGTGPSAGDGKAPHLVDSGNLLWASDSELAQVAGSVETELSLVNSSVTAAPEDNPLLITSSGTGNRRNRRRYGPTARI